MTEALPVHVTVVIPTRNEEAAIVDTIRSVPRDGWCEKLDLRINDVKFPVPGPTSKMYLSFMGTILTIFSKIFRSVRKF